MYTVHVGLTHRGQFGQFSLAVKFLRVVYNVWKVDWPRICHSSHCPQFWPVESKTDLVSSQESTTSTQLIDLCKSTDPSLHWSLIIGQTLLLEDSMQICLLLCWNLQWNWWRYIWWQILEGGAGLWILWSSAIKSILINYLVQLVERDTSGGKSQEESWCLVLLRRESGLRQGQGRYPSSNPAPPVPQLPLHLHCHPHRCEPIHTEKWLPIRHKTLAKISVATPNTPAPAPAPQLTHHCHCQRALRLFSKWSSYHCLCLINWSHYHHRHCNWRDKAILLLSRDLDLWDLTQLLPHSLWSCHASFFWPAPVSVFLLASPRIMTVHHYHLIQCALTRVTLLSRTATLRSSTLSSSPIYFMLIITCPCFRHPATVLPSSSLRESTNPPNHTGASKPAPN